MSGHEGTSDPRDVLRLLRRRGWILLLCVLAIPVGTYYYTKRLPKLYQASVTIQPQPTASDGAALALGEQTPTLQSVAAVARLAETSGVADEASRVLGEPPGSTGGVTAVADDLVGFITLTATASTAQRATDVANAHAEALGTQRAKRAKSRINAAVSLLRRNVEGESDPCLLYTSDAATTPYV